MEVNTIGYFRNFIPYTVNWHGFENNRHIVYSVNIKKF